MELISLLDENNLGIVAKILKGKIKGGILKMAVMRSILYVPGNNPKMVEKAPSFPADIITLDLEDSVPPAEKENARKIIAENLKYAGSNGSQIYVRINNWETELTNDDLEAVVWEGLHGVTLAKTGHPDDVKRLDWKLEELERRRGLEVGSIKISMLLETAKGIMNAYECCMASKRNVNAIFGAVDYCRDMRIKLTSEANEQLWGRAKVGVACRAAGIVAIDAPFVAYQDIPAFEKNVADGKQMGYEGRMIIHPGQVEPSNRLYAPDPADVEWANGVVKVFEEEGIAKGKAAVSYNGKMVDTPVYLNAKDILAAQAEIEAKEA
ncbi:Citrate lyase beta chain [Dehalobacter sp. UNSWDHB]|nr:Citrate lyase beta chain [Dehalobacter sp. DCA]AFV04402.1 Citrate lyase beta chain [Dehalobacter sp. CF]EQB21473.1 Citrate lyase beta chain [Dehalobacter sp. UNSWDHB]